MKKSKFTEEQIDYALKQAESGTSVLDVCCRLGISEQTFYRWKKKLDGLGVAELRRHRRPLSRCLLVKVRFRPLPMETVSL